ncbi:MAG: hypothetical protein IJ552_08635 [Prevotella sp.]|nr:hypothetical protein [Prevotella sp.]
MRKLLFLLPVLLGCFQIALAQSNAKLEAENASYVNCTLTQDSKYSGGKALEITKDDARITFKYNNTAKGKYTVYVGYDGLYGDKSVNLSVNGSSGTFLTKGKGETAVGNYFMNQGENAIVITPFWTWFRIDYIRIEKSTDALPFNIASAPVDQNATESAKKMYAFLYNNFGKKTISGIMTGDMSSANGDVTQHDDVKAVYQASDKYPALIGFDFMNTTGANEDDYWSMSYTNAVIRLVKDTYMRGGIPAFTWHWRDPSRNTNEFYTDRCYMKISNAMKTDGTWNTSSTLYQNIIKDIDVIADYFIELQDAGIACIFRPLHEASGGWFWWGREGAEPFKKLYRLIFEEMVNVKGVHNVIWVWNAGEYDQDWDPGEAYYDVVSADIYNADYDYSSNYFLFDKLKELTGGTKILALSENGPIPDIDKEFAEEAVWSWWMPWYQTWGGNFVNKTSKEKWRKCMNDDRIVTLEDLSAGWDAYTTVRNPKVSNNTCQGIYDLQGRQLSEIPCKGLYIRGGKIMYHSLQR